MLKISSNCFFILSLFSLQLFNYLAPLFSPPLCFCASAFSWPVVAIKRDNALSPFQTNCAKSGQQRCEREQEALRRENGKAAGR